MNAERLLSLARGEGFSLVELSVYPSQESHDFFLSLRDELDGFTLTNHFPLHSEAVKLLWSKNLVRRRAGLNSLLKSVGVLQDLGVKYYTIHPGSEFCPLEEYALLRDSLSDAGIKLLVENVRKGVNAGVGEAVRLCKALSVGLTLDVGHAFITKDELSNLSYVRGLVKHVHLHDVRERDHLGLGSGFVRLPEVVQALKSVGFDGGVVLEVHHDPNFEQALVQSKKVLDVLWSGF